MQKTKTPRLSAAAAALLVLSVGFAEPSLAAAKKKSWTDTIAHGARTVACSPVANAHPTGRAFGNAVKAWDRAGWEAGRYIYRVPDRYPGPCRR